MLAINTQDPRAPEPRGQLPYAEGGGGGRGGSRVPFTYTVFTELMPLKNKLYNIFS
jgi:hypothetical protein